MKSFAIRDFRSRPRQVQEALRDANEALLTSNGRPVALMVPVDAGNLDETLSALRSALAMRALDALRSQAKNQGTSELSDREIEKIIHKSRKARVGSSPARS